MTSSAAGVLIVEDELIVAHDLKQSLGDMGYDAFAIAGSGEEAVACAEARWPDVVLMDIRIKGPEDGITTASLLKSKDPVIVIFLTAHADDSMVDRAKQTTPDGYLLKPVKVAELRTTIEVALHKRQLEAEKEKTRAQEHRLFTITNNVPIAIAYFDRKGVVQFANSIFRSLVPYKDNPIGISAMTFLGESLYRASYPMRQQALLGEGATLPIDIEQNGITRRYAVTYLPDYAVGGMVMGVYALGYDMTEREQLAASLRRSQSDLEAILNDIPARVISWNRDLRSRFANAAARAEHDVLRKTSVGHELRDVLGEKRYRVAQKYVELALAGQPSTHEEVEEEEAGTRRYSSHHLIPEWVDGVVQGIHSLAFDETELRQSHEQIRQLAGRVDSVREEERRAVSAILHDGIAQDLFAVKLDLDHLAKQTRDQKGAHELCETIASAVGHCMDETRLIANELRPAALGSRGLTAVITEYARRFAVRSDLKIRVMKCHGFPTLEEPAQVLLFRSAQEALTNVARHAHASAVTITFRTTDDHIILEIADDGIGITDSAVKKPLSLGIIALRERLAALGGTLALTRNTPRGTVFSVQLTSR